jgi:hypothetical protein
MGSSRHPDLKLYKEIHSPDIAASIFPLRVQQEGKTEPKAGLSCG